jgi:predicted HTH transcriptional regulator
MHLIAGDPAISYDDMAEKMGKGRTTIMHNVQKLKRLGYLRRVGAKKVGHWEVSQEYAEGGGFQQSGQIEKNGSRIRVGRGIFT